MDAGFVDVPRQRNSREENAQIKAGETPARFEANPSVKAQKDTQARWAGKNQETHFGYKNHIAIDNKHKLIRAYEVTSAELTEDRAVEHVFGSVTNEQGGLYFRVIGLACKATKIGLMNLVYNMRRRIQIDRLHASGA